MFKARQEKIGDYIWSCEDSQGDLFSYGSLNMRFGRDADFECAEACVDSASGKPTSFDLAIFFLLIWCPSFAIVISDDHELKQQCINLTGVETNAKTGECHCLFERPKTQTVGGGPWTGSGGGSGTGPVGKKAYFAKGWTCNTLLEPQLSSCAPETPAPVRKCSSSFFTSFSSFRIVNFKAPNSCHVLPHL